MYIYSQPVSGVARRRTLSTPLQLHCSVSHQTGAQGGKGVCRAMRTCVYIHIYPQVG